MTKHSRRPFAVLSARVAGMFAFVAVLLLMTAPGCGKKERTRLFVIGLDGATWDLLDPWIAAGELPNLAALRERSAWGTMNSVIPFLSPPAWTSAITGVNPGRHGIFDFQRRRGPGQREIVTETAKSRKCSPIWKMIAGAGKKVAIVNVPMTDPPDDDVDGLLMIAGLPHLDQTGFTHPRELETRLRSSGYLLEKMEMQLPPGSEDSTFTRLTTSLERRWETVRDLYSEVDYDLFWVVFTESDRVQHMFWKFDDPDNPGYSAESAARWGGSILRLWKQQDRILGELLAGLRPDTWVLVISDHGFGPMRRELRVSNHLRGDDAGWTDEEAHEVFCLDRSDAARLYVRAPIRDPGGHLDSLGQATLRAKLEATLSAARDPADNAAPIEEVFRKEQVFVGPLREKGPDLTALASYGWYLHWGDGDTTAVSRPAFGPPSIALSGWHRMNGIFLLSGPQARAGKIETPYSLLDVAPTCLHLLGHPVAEDLEGRVMESAFAQDWMRSHPIERGGRVNTEERPQTEEERNQLRNLPYVK